MTRNVFLLAVSLAFIASAEPARIGGAAKQDSKKARVDQDGDPLPKQALFRIGTTRLQHKGSVQGVAASEDGRFLASYGRDRMVRVWNAKDGRPIWTFELGSTEPWALAFSRDGKELAAVSKSSPKQAPDGAFRRWDLTTGRELPNGRDRPVLDIRSMYFVYHVALACGDDGKFLAAETVEADIVLYSPDAPASAKTLKGHTGRVMSVCFTKDGKTLVSLGDDGTIRLWNTADDKEFAQLSAPPMKDHALKGNFAFVAVSPDGKNLAVTLPDGSTRLLDAAGRELRRLRSSEQMNALAFSPDGKALFTGGNWIDAWKVDDAKPIAFLNQPRNPLRALTLSPDGKFAACADDRDRVRLVEIGTGTIVCDREMSCRGGIAFSPQGKLLAVAPGDNTVALWDVAALRAPEKPIRAEPTSFLRCDGKVDAFAFSPDGKRLATVEGTVSRIYDVASKKATHTLTPSGRKLYGVAFSADGKLLATMGEQPSFRPGLERETVPQAVGLWDSFAGKELALGEDLRQIAHTVVFHPGGKSLVAIHLPMVARDIAHSGSRISTQAVPVEDRMETIRVWNAGFTRERFRFEDPVRRKNAERASAWIIGRSQAVAAAFSPDGWLFATEGPGGIVLFETASGQPRLRLGGHLGEITALAFTPDGNTLVSTSRDSTLLIWDVTGLRTGSKSAGSSDEHWALLADADAEKAGRAVYALVDAPAAALALLRKQLQPVAVSQDRLQKLVDDLDHANFAVRDRAQRELAPLGPLAEPPLTKKRQAKSSLEAARRIDELLAGIKSVRPLPDHLRTIRAVEVLDRIGSRESDAFLRELAAGSEGAYLTIHAREALNRSKR